MSEHESPNKLSSQTTPTWEVELLISGVAVFAMLQLPGWLDDGIFALAPRLDASWAKLVELLYYYAKSATVILAATFVIHLLLRARWIALVGMHSVYPDGVRWDRLRMGPVQREVEQRYQIPTEVIIERADNLATTVFAVGVMVALILAIVTLTAGVLLGISKLLGSVVGWDGAGLTVTALLFTFVMFLFALVTSLDRRYGKTWEPGGLPHRVSFRALTLFNRMGLGRSKNRIMALLISNGGERKMIAMTTIIMATAIISVMLAYAGMRHHTLIGNYEFFPSATATSVKPSQYDDQRDAQRDSVAPFIESMVASGPYLKLIVPYLPRQDGPAMRTRCGMATTVSSKINPRLLACLQAMHPVMLDGKLLGNLRYEVASDARTNRPALLAMIDIRTLADGRHELRIGRAPPPQTSPDEKVDMADPDKQDYLIPFWK